MLKKYILPSGLLLLACLLQSQVSLKKKSQKELNDILEGSEAKAVEAYFHTGSGSIQGSICVGIDCAASESFGFDTQRFKENNLRIHFDDTSTGAFPANDWRIVLNSSASSGGSFFGIEDATSGKSIFKIESGAPSNSFHLDNGGKVGLGTSNPSTEIHILDGDSPTIRMEQDGSSGFNPQTWDMAGNETNFFIRDVTNGSRLPFRIRPSAPSNSIFVDTDGDLGFGTSSPRGRLHLSNGSDTLLLVDDNGKMFVNDSLRIAKKGIVFPDGSVQTIAFGGANGAYTDLDVTGTAHFHSDVYVKGSIFPSASFGPSDKRLKQSLEDLKDASGLLMKLYPKSYYFKTEFVKSLGLPEDVQYGLLAQDVESILPELIKEFDTKSGGRFKSVNYTSIIPILIQGFKEQEERIRTLEEELKSMTSLEKRIMQLESASQKSTVSNAKR